ncbi:MAG: AAA family ATPase [Candidatus Riflebacteria bacterium]|nr:AAA family ATPase [Candidatus Riflebacteria bacterium]
MNRLENQVDENNEEQGTIEDRNQEQNSLKSEQSEKLDVLRKRAKALMAEFGLSQNQASKEIGVSGAMLNQWLSGKYTAEAKSEQKICRWIEFKTEKLKINAFPDDPDWQATPTGKKIINVLTYAQMARDIAVIYGSAGIGKSKTIEHYSNLNPSVWVVTMNKTIKNLNIAMQLIAETVGVKISGSPTAFKFFRPLVNALKGTNGLLIIDEAQHLNLGSLEAIRGLHDESKIGIALVGNESVYGQLTGGKRSAEFAQLFSRVGKRLRLVKPHSEDILAIAKTFGIESKIECDFLKDIGTREGALRGLIKTLRLASLTAYGAKEKVSLNHIQEAWINVSRDN